MSPSIWARDGCRQDAGAASLLLRSVLWALLALKGTTALPQDRISQFLHEFHFLSVLLCHICSSAGHTTAPRRAVCHWLTLCLIVIQLHVLFRATRSSSTDDTASCGSFLRSSANAAGMQFGRRAICFYGNELLEQPQMSHTEETKMLQCAQRRICNVAEDDVSRGHFNRIRHESHYVCLVLIQSGFKLKICLHFRFKLELNMLCGRRCGWLWQRKKVVLEEWLNMHFHNNFLDNTSIYMSITFLLFQLHCVFV